MKTKSFILAVLFALGLITASLNSNSGYCGNNDLSSNWKKSDTTDSNGGGGPVPPIGH